MTRSPRIARVLLTRDATESADIVVEILDDESPLEAAIRQVKESDWAIDEGNSHRPYFGDDENDVQAASQEDLEHREEHLGNLADVEREQALVAAAKELLGGEDVFHLLETHSISINGGEQTRNHILWDLEKAIVDTLRKSAAYRVGPTPTP